MVFSELIEAVHRSSTLLVTARPSPHCFLGTLLTVIKKIKYEFAYRKGCVVNNNPRAFHDVHLHDVVGF